MKLLQIFGAVLAIHVLAFVFIFASPGCSSGPRSVPTPDATMQNGNVDTPAESVDVTAAAGAVTYAPPPAAGRATPTRPGSPAAVAVTPAKPVTTEVAPVSTYTVERGDSLWSIAKRNKLSVAELAKANNIRPNTPLSPGKKLIIPVKPGAAPTPQDLSTTPEAPAAAAAAAAPVAETKTAARGEAVKHTIQSGESLGIIARKYQVTVGELAAANGITDPAKIRAGQQLVIPGFKAVASKPAASTRSTGASSHSTPATSAPATTPAAETAPAATPPPADAVPHFEIKPPPPGQDLDAGLKDSGTTEVPTIKIEEVKPTPAPKG